MRRYQHVGVLADAPAGLAPAGRTTVHRRLLSQSWARDVDAIEAAIGRFDPGGSPAEACEVAFFELANDPYLHVNVTHRYLTKPVAGWAGPGRVSGGFVHNRRFVDTASAQIIRHVRDMVFAPRA